MNERYKKGQVEGAKENKDEFRTKGRKCKWKDKRREQKRKKKNSHENEAQWLIWVNSKEILKNGDKPFFSFGMLWYRSELL